MKLTVNRSKRTPRSPRAFALGSLLLGAALLSACGGGSNQVQAFTATRVIALGDESSLINPDGTKYTVNAVVFDTTTTPPTPTTKIDCASNPIWVQLVAGAYGLVFPQCNPAAVAAPVSRIYAVNGAKVADLAAQIDQQIASGGFAPTDLVTILVGPNDVVAQFAQYPAVGEATLAGNLDQSGKALAAQVNRVAELGAKVLIATIPDMGLAPFAGDRSVGAANTNAGVLTRLSVRFNDALLAEIFKLVNDGHKVGLVQLDEYMQAVDRARANGTGSFANTTLAACLPTAPLPVCTSQTLGTDANAIPAPATVSPASATSWLWADGQHLSAGGQASLGSLAVTRARNNPF